MHVFFWAHLHLSSSLKVTRALQWGPCTFECLQICPRLLPRVPDLLCFCRARVIHRRRLLSEPLQACAALPSPTCRFATSSTACAASAVSPPSCHVGSLVLSNRHAPEGHAGAARRHDPGPVTALPLPLFYLAVLCYKARPEPHLPA
jgi:hypothetical protein